MDHNSKPPFRASIALRLASTQAYPALIGLEAANDPDNGESTVEAPVNVNAAPPLQSVPTGKSKVHQLRTIK